jgi:hypothetical protein
MELRTFTLTERPELACRRRELDAEWPRFLHYDPTGLFFIWHEEPHVPIAEYAARTRPDGLPSDPWPRAYARLGASVLKVAPYSTVIPARWPSGGSGQGCRWIAPARPSSRGALVPVVASLEHDNAVYVEPNVWMRHAL